MRILGKSKKQGTILHNKGIVVKVHSSKRRKVKLSGFSVTYDAGRKQLTKKRVIRFRRAGTRKVKLKLLHGMVKNVRGCTARKIRVHAGRAKSQVQMQRTLGPCRLPSINLGKAKKCDFIADPGNALCMLPFPDNYYTAADSSSETGRRIDFKTERDAGQRLRRAHRRRPYNASNGFSQGATILVKIPGIETAADVKAMGATPINHLGRYKRKNTSVVVIDAKTGKRWPIWAEIDSTAEEPSQRALEIHPAVNFASGHRYIVAIRHVKNAAGKKIEAPAAFRYYRDEVASKQGPINARRKHFKGIFSKLKKAGVRRESLYLAWDFTVATDMNNARPRCWRCATTPSPSSATRTSPTGSSRAASPSFEVESSEAEDEGKFPRVKGTYGVPCYLFPSCGPGGTSSSAPTKRRSRTAPGPGQLRLHRPGGRRKRPRAGPRSTGTGCSAAPARSPRARRRNWPNGTTSSPARPTRSGCPRKTRRRRWRSCTTLSYFPRARRPPAAGRARRALPGPADDQRRRLRHRPGLPERQRPAR